MSLAIRFDSSSLGLLNSLRLDQSLMFKSMEKLSSGFRINRASDGPAELVISEQLRSRIASLQQEIDNSLGQISRYETGQSAAMELRTYLTDLRSLAVGASNEGFNSEAAQAALDNEAQVMVATFNDLRSNAEFNGKALLDGSEGSLVEISELSGIDLSSADSAQASLAQLDSAISEVDSALVELGAIQKYELERGVRSMEVTKENLVAAESMIRDVDMVAEYINFMGEMFKMKMGVALLAHSGMNAETVISLFD